MLSCWFGMTWRRGMNFIFKITPMKMSMNQTGLNQWLQTQLVNNTLVLLQRYVIWICLQIMQCLVTVCLWLCWWFIFSVSMRCQLCLIVWLLPLLAYHKVLSNYVFIAILNIHLIFLFLFTFIGSNCLVAFLFTTGSVRYSLHSICIMLWLFYRPWVSYLIKRGYFLFINHVRHAMYAF